MKHIYYNQEKKEYTFSEYDGETQNKSVIPPKYSPADKYAKYRRMAQEQKK